MSLIVDIHKKTGGFALNVSFETKGGVHALLGSSGSGKSMTLKCIAGIMTPDEGYIELDGRVLFDSGERSGRKVNLPPQKRSVGYMFQDYALFPTMTVLQNVMEGMGKRRDSGKAQEILRRFHVEELADRLPGRLSGGQKQRVAMARIAAQEPALILLDEPFSALDSHLKWVLQNEMKTTLETLGCPAVMVTHSRDEVYRLCSSVCCLRDGHSEQTRGVREFFQNPETVAGAKLSGCKNVSPVQVVDDHTLFAGDWQIPLYFAKGLPADAGEWLYAVGIRAHRLHADPRAEDDNCFAVADPVVMEDPFEWNVSFYPGNEGRTVSGDAAGRIVSGDAAGRTVSGDAAGRIVSGDAAGQTTSGDAAGPAQPLLWRIAKGEEDLKIPDKVYLSSGDIMLLRK